MRTAIALLAVSTCLTACGGGSGAGPTFAGGTPPPTTGGSGGGDEGTGHSFVDPTETRTYQGIGGAQSYSYLVEIDVDAETEAFVGDSTGHQAQTYAGNASTARNSNIEITYDPRGSLYTLRIADPASGSNVQTAYQDPAARTDFGGSVEPQWGVPDLGFQNVTIFEAGDGDPISPYRRSGSGSVQVGRNDLPPLGTPGSSFQAVSYFFQNPGSGTDYVTFAGFLRNAYSYSQVTPPEEDVDANPVYQVRHELTRGVFAFGERTGNSDVPTSGSFDFSGNMLATMLNNPTIDGENGQPLPSFFQWIEGSADFTVDFANDEVRDILFAGTVTDPQVDALTQIGDGFDPNMIYTFVPGGSRFEAAGEASIDLVNAGGFLGAITSARFLARNGNAFADGSTTQELLIEGSSIDGAFFGPNGEEIGGGFRIVGGVPDERIDILGTFTAGRD